MMVEFCQPAVRSSQRRRTSGWSSSDSRSLHRWEPWARTRRRSRRSRAPGEWRRPPRVPRPCTAAGRPRRSARPRNSPVRMLLMAGRFHYAVERHEFRQDQPSCPILRTLLDRLPGEELLPHGGPLCRASRPTPRGSSDHPRRGRPRLVRCRPGRPRRDLPPIVGQMQLRGRVECRRRERRQPHQVSLVLLGELALELIGGLDEPVVLAVEPMRGNREPAPHRSMVVDLVPEGLPLRMSAELPIRQPDRPAHLVGERVDAEALRRCSVVPPPRVVLGEGAVRAGVSPPSPVRCVAAPWCARAGTLASSAASARTGRRPAGSPRGPQELRAR
jgi:hypothetical protein